MTDHYFSNTPGRASTPQSYAFVVDQHTFTIDTGTGIFGSKKLDKGTAVLLSAHEARRLPSPALDHGDILDIGCGAGPLSMVLAHFHPNCTVWAVDVNDRALEMCRENAKKNKLRNIQIVRPDAVPTDAMFSLIWSNPPIRIGKKALQDLMLYWLSRLTPDGVALVVMNKNLGADSFSSWLQQQRFRVNRCGSSKGFRLLAITRAETFDQ